MFFECYYFFCEIVLKSTKKALNCFISALILDLKVNSNIFNIQRFQMHRDYIIGKELGLEFTVVAFVNLQAEKKLRHTKKQVRYQNIMYVFVFCFWTSVFPVPKFRGFTVSWLTFRSGLKWQRHILILLAVTHNLFVSINSIKCCKCSVPEKLPEKTIGIDCNGNKSSIQIILYFPKAQWIIWGLNFYQQIDDLYIYFGYLEYSICLFIYLSNWYFYYRVIEPLPLYLTYIEQWDDIIFYNKPKK